MPQADHRKRYVLVTADVNAVLNRLKGEQESPRQDFTELSRALNAEMLSFSDALQGSFLTRCLARSIGPAVALAWMAFWKRGSFYFVTAENTAIPLAILLKFRPGMRLFFIGHRLTPSLKRRIFCFFRLSNQVARMFCYSRQQEQFAQTSLGLSADQVRRIAFQVDEQFFTPVSQPEPTRGVVSVGRELRDYPTLFRALENTDVPVTVVASSPWSVRKDQTASQKIPDNVTLRKGLSNAELRDLYRHAAVVVVPIKNVDWPAGVTSLFEGQACARPVVVSASEGILDSLDEGAAVTVPCGDADALREAVLSLINNPERAESIGRAGHASVVQTRTLNQFVERISSGCRLREGQGEL